MNQQPGDRRPNHGKVRQIRQDYAGLVTTLVILLILTAVIVTCTALRLHRSPLSPDPAPADQSSVAAGDKNPGENDPGGTTPDDVPKYVNLTMSEKDLSKGDLILVNRDHHFDPAAATGSVTNVRDGRTTKIQENSFQLPIGEPALAALESMQQGMVEVMKDGMRLLVNAGYRTAEAQQSIIDSYTESRGEEYVVQYVAPVGASEHHTVYASDISFYDTTSNKVLATKSADAAAYYSWCLLNCKNYGLILRYTADKVDITGYSEESWHFRYVGIPHASYIYEHSLALEEYIEQLKVTNYSSRLYVTTEDGRCYSIYYTAASGATTQVPVPKQQKYTVSGNNADGFIVTVEEENGAPEGAMTVLVTEDSSAAASGNAA